MKRSIDKIVKKYAVGAADGRVFSGGAAGRETRPVWDRARCFMCGLCYMSCPDSAVIQMPDGFYDSIPDRCTGCGVCAAECWNDAITMTPEKGR